MMRRFVQFGSGLAALLLAASFACAAPAQRAFLGGRRQVTRMQRQAERQAIREQQRAQRQAQKQQGKPNARALMGLPPKWVEKLQDRSPEEQERFMRNNARFRSLPPWRQEQIRRNLERWNQLTPQQREAMRNRERLLERMTPEERKEVVNDLAPRWKNLPQDRKQILAGRLRVLGGMSPEERQQKLQDPQFMQGLDPNEQDLLRKLSNLRLGPNPGQ